MKYIKCSQCGAKKNIRHQRYRKLLALNQNNRDRLKSTYICRDCKLSNATRLVQNNLKCICLNTSIQQLSGYSQLQKELNLMAKELHTKGIQSHQNRDQFYVDVKQTLLKYYFRDFLINVKDNKVVSIELQNVPFTGKHNIEIKE
jgi:hypothetical protein